MDVYLARRKTAARAGVSWQGAPGNRIFMKENKINRRNNMEFLWEGVMAITPQQFVMYLIGGLLIWLAVKKEYEPALLLPMGFGAIMVTLPLSGVINQVTEGIGETQGIIQWLFETTISASEALPILLFIGIGAMIDFGPLLSQPIMFLFGAAAQFGIFFAICAASLMGFELRDAESSVRRMDRLPFWFPRSCIPTMWARSRWRRTPTWRWCQSSSHLRSVW